jgi:peptidoglycan hydrolase CwlO-like protein
MLNEAVKIRGFTVSENDVRRNIEDTKRQMREHNWKIPELESEIQRLQQELALRQSAMPRLQKTLTEQEALLQQVQGILAFQERVTERRRVTIAES